MAATNRLAGLKSALETAAGKSRAVHADAEEPPIAADKAGKGRSGQIHIGAWLPAEAKTSLRMILVKTGRDTVQELIAEALNDLFEKYDVPVIKE